ncbi:MAG: glycosyl hydrolase, partial [Candidatus Zipacnadales bacterium]
MRTVAVTFTMLVFLALAPFAQQAHTLGDHWGNLEGEWRFRADPEDVGEMEGWSSPNYDDSEWRMLTVPGLWEPQGITDPRPGEPPRPKNGMPWSDYDGVAWYRLRFTVPESWKGQGLTLQLGSVDDQDRTYFNGQLVGETGPGVQRSVLVQRVYRVPADMVVAGAENVLAIRVYDGGGPGGLQGPIVSLLPSNLTEEPLMLPPDDRPLAERFANPPASCRILKIVHGLPDEPEALDLHIRALAAQGFGGMATNVAFAEYMQSEAKWNAFVRGVTKAKEAGMSLWLYDEKGYPSGAAGGQVLEGHPEWEARGLLIAEANTTGEAVNLDVPPGRLRLARAFPRVNETVRGEGTLKLADHVREGRLVWKPPEGAWHVMVITEERLYEGTHAALSLADKLPYINLLMPEPTQRFLEVTHAEYAKRLGDDLGKYFVSTFTDEPSLMSLFLRPMPYKVLPWAPNLPQTFHERRGYELEPVLPALIGNIVVEGRPVQQVRYDFWLTVAELVSENYFGQIQDWCNQHNLRSGGHLLWEESLCNHVAFYGDFFRCLRRMDAPSIDCLTSIPAHVPWQIARLIGSAADLDGRLYTMSETSDHAQRYRPQGDERPVVQVSENEIRGTCNREILGGINTITSYYSFAGLTTEQLRRLNEWVGRCCTMLRGGHQVTDLAVVYPIESVWTCYTPARHMATDSSVAAQIEQIYNSVSNDLFIARRDFTYLDSRTLAESEIADGSLVHGKMSWRVVILPHVITLPATAWEKLEWFWETGGVLIGVGARPTNTTDEFPSSAVQRLGEKLLGTGEKPTVQVNEAGGVAVYLPVNAASLLPAILDAVIEPDVHVSDAQLPLRVTHRRIEDHDVYFVINDSPSEISARLAPCGEGFAERWDPATGISERIALGEVSLDLGPYGGMFFRYERVRARRRFEVKPGSLPNIEMVTLPATQPTHGHGEFVRGSLSEDIEHSREGMIVWKATGTLTK